MRKERERERAKARKAKATYLGSFSFDVPFLSMSSSHEREERRRSNLSSRGTYLIAWNKWSHFVKERYLCKKRRRRAVRHLRRMVRQVVQTPIQRAVQQQIIQKPKDGDLTATTATRGCEWRGRMNGKTSTRYRTHAVGPYARGWILSDITQL